VAIERDPYEVLEVSRTVSWQELRAAYRSLVRRYHPDGTSPDTRRMVEINAAYECLERSHPRPSGRTSVGIPVGPGHPAASSDPLVTGVTGVAPSAPEPPRYGALLDRVRAAQRVETPVVDFGQYAGWSVAEIAQHDPRYLRWLSRHSSGLRFRSAIERVLGADPEIGRRAAIVG
jgi:DnaJ domain